MPCLSMIYRIETGDVKNSYVELPDGLYIYTYPRRTGTALPSLSSFVPLCDGSVGCARFCKDRYWIVLVTSHVFFRIVDGFV